MTQKNRVFGIIYESENNTLYHGSAAFRDKLGAAGYEATLLDLKDPSNFQVLYQALGSGECAFAFGLQGIGSQLRFKDQNLWHVAKVPFISLHFDHPSHALTNHASLSPYIANLYSFDAFLYDYETYVKPIRNEERVSGRIMIDTNTNRLPIKPFEQRDIKFLYLKSGVSLAPYEHHINGLPKLLREGVWDRLAIAEKNPNLSLCDLAVSLFPKDTFADPANQVEFWAIVKAMDLYLRHKRAITFVNWLKFQEGAVIVGNGWDEIDKDGARASFRPSVEAKQAYQMYPNTQFICNTSPYGRDVIHERICLGLIHECAVITDSNEWLNTNLATTPNMLMFDWATPLDAQIESQVAQKLSISDTFEAGKTAAYSLFTQKDCDGTIVKAVEKVFSLVKTLT